MLEAANPSIKGGRHGGDIQGVINALPYLNDLGVTQLWLTPVLENNMPNYSYHGYAITGFYKVDPRMGSNQLYKTLSVKAKEQGIGLVMDMVLNHFGSEHTWVKDKPTKDWINLMVSLIKARMPPAMRAKPYKTHTPVSTINASLTMAGL